MLERLKNNWTAKALALGMALLLWFYVNDQRIDPLEEIYSNIPVEVVGLADDLALTNKPPSVQVRVTGSNSSLATLTSRDIEAVADASGVTPGSNLVPVNVKAPPGIEVLSVSPGQVNMTVDMIVEERWPVAANVEGKLADDYIFLEPQLQPGFVFLVGANNVLGEVREVFVSVELTEGMTNDLRISLPLQIVGEDRQPVTPAVRSNPQWVEVLVPIQAAVETKEVPITYELVGEAPEGYSVEVRVEPEELNLAGAPSVLAQLDQLSLGEIDISQLYESAVLTKRVELPEKVEPVSDSSLEVRVIVDVTAPPEENEENEEPVSEN